MKQFFLRALLPFLLFISTFFSAFLPHPRTNALFSYTKIPLIQTAAQTPSETPAIPSAGDYACILTDDVFFYSTADGRRGLFLLPKSYYVRLLEYRTDYCKIEYQTEASAKRLIGYARTEDLTFVDYVPARPYLYYTFDIRYKIDDTQPTDSTFLTEITVSCVYYGDYLIGSERYCYVLRGDDYLASLQPDPTPPDTQGNTEEEKSSPAQIAILVAICLLVPILAALVLKPPRRPPYEVEE